MTASTLSKSKSKVKGKVQKVRRNPLALKRRLTAAGVTYGDIARLAGVSWFTVWAVVNGRRTSAPVMRSLRKLLGVSHAS